MIKKKKLCPGKNGAKAVTKKKLLKKDPAYKKAVDYLKSGGSLDTIKAKYELTDVVEKELSKV